MGAELEKNGPPPPELLTTLTRRKRHGATRDAVAELRIHDRLADLDGRALRVVQIPAIVRLEGGHR